MSFTKKIIFAMISGILFGVFLNITGFIDQSLQPLIIGFFDLVSYLFISSLKLIIIPLIFFSIVCGIVSLSDDVSISRLGIKTLSLYVMTTVIAITLGLLFSSFISYEPILLNDMDDKILTDNLSHEVNFFPNNIFKSLTAKGVSVKYDNRTSHKPGWKFNEYELKGVPLRIAIGPKDLEKGTVELARRDTLQKQFVSMDEVSNLVPGLLTEIQEQLYNKALEYRDEHITKVDDFNTFKELLNSKTGFFSCHWDGTTETEDKIKDLTKATIRCIPLNAPEEEGNCILTGAPSKRRVLFAKAY